MGAGVPIRPVNQTVETPSPGLPSNPLRAEPLQSGAGAALSSAGDALFGIWQKQQQERNAIDLNDRVGHFQQDFGQAKVNALNSGQQAPDMVKQLQETSDSLIQAYTTAPANKAIAPQLALLMREHAGREMGTFPIEATDRVRQDTDYRARTQVLSAAEAVAPNYTIDGTATAPVFRDSTTAPNGGVAGQDQEDHNRAMIQGLYNPVARKAEYDFYNAQYAHEKAVQRGNLVAQDHPSLIDDYIKQNPSLTGDERIALMNQATAAITRPTRQYDANNEAEALKRMRTYDAQALAGKLDVASLERDARFKLIPDSYYQKMTGMPLAIPSDPGAVQAATDAINSASDKDVLDGLHATIAANPNIRGKESVALPILIENKKRQIATPAGQADIEARARIEAAAVPTNIFDEKLNGPSYRAARIQQLKAYEAATFGKPSDPKIYTKAADEAIAAHPPKLMFPPTKSGAAPTPSAPPPGAPPRLPGETMEAYGKRAKALMGIH